MDHKVDCVVKYCIVLHVYLYWACYDTGTVTLYVEWLELYSPNNLLLEYKPSLIFVVINTHTDVVVF